MRTFVGSLVAAAAVAGLCASPVAALDRFETENNASGTDHQLVHGVRDVLDLEGTDDQDWMLAQTQAGHSYEVRSYSHNGTVNMNFGGALLERVDAAGVSLQAADNPGGAIGYSSLRWISAAGGQEFVRVSIIGTQAATSLYDVDFFDTTYLVPRWNNAGAQITVFLIQNASRAVVTGNIEFYNAAGTLLFTQPLNVPVNGSQSFNTASAPALVGFGGSARIANDAPWGALAGKAVAVEPSTGFTFDTQILPITR